LVLHNISLLPLYSGPQITIRIGSTSHEYKPARSFSARNHHILKRHFEGEFRREKRNQQNYRPVQCDWHEDFDGRAYRGRYHDETTSEWCVHDNRSEPEHALPHLPAYYFGGTIT